MSASLAPFAVSDRDSLALSRDRARSNATHFEGIEALCDLMLLVHTRPVERTGLNAALQSCDAYIATRVHGVTCNAARMRVVRDAARTYAHTLLGDPSRTVNRHHVQSAVDHLEWRLSRTWLLPPGEHDGGRAEMSRLAGG
jgi:hypothetical protein